MFGLFNKPEAKASRALKLEMQRLPDAEWTKFDYKAASEEGYQQNVIAFSAINRLATSVANITFQVRVGDQVETAHPLIDLMKRPNPMQSGHAWWLTRVGYCMLSGNIYDEIVMSEDGKRIVELWPLRPDRMTISRGPSGLPRAYHYRNGGTLVNFPADTVTGESLINHTKLFNPLNDTYGLSPVSAAAYGIDQHNESANWIKSLLQNSARPSGALVVDKDTSLSDEEFRRLQSETEEKYSGSRNAGRPMLLEGGLEWKAMGLSPVDMEILKAREMAAREVSLAFGVPPLLLNIPGDNTFANYREARLGFYEDTVIPFVRYMLAELNHFFSTYYPDAVLEIAMDSIEAIAEKRMKQWAMADASDDITLNESRRLKGLPPLPDPLGGTLMSEIRAGTRGDSPSPELTKAEDEAYGRR